MPRTGRTPSIVPKGADQNAYPVIDDFGRNGRVCCEADVETTNLETVVVDLLEGPVQKSGPRHRLQHLREMVAGFIG